MNEHLLFWILLIIVSTIFYIKDNWQKIEYRRTDRKLIKKAKKYKKQHKKNILKKRKGKNK